jgi:autotransporter family porin
VYQYLTLGGFNDGVSDVSGTSARALRGRAGFRLYPGKELEVVGGLEKPHFMENYLRDFLSPAKTTIGGTVVGANPSRNMIEVGGAV